MIAQTYCGGTHFHGGLRCGPDAGPCPSCLRAHIAKLEAALRNAEAEAAIFHESQQRALRERNEAIDKLEEALDAATEEILLSRQSEGETMRDLLETRERLATAEASYAESLEARRVTEAEAARNLEADVKKLLEPYRKLNVWPAGIHSAMHVEVEEDRLTRERLAAGGETALLAGLELMMKINKAMELADHEHEVVLQLANKKSNLEARIRELEAQAAAQAGGVVPELLAIEKFADNGAHSHWTIIRRDTGEAVWEEPDPDEDSRTEIPLLIQALPASRVLGEGEIKGAPEELAEIARGAAYKWMRDGSHQTVLIQYIADALRAAKGGA